MNSDRIKGAWKQVKGNVKRQWGKLTGDPLDVVEGKRDILAGQVQDAYGVTKDAADKQLTAWQKRMNNLKPLE